ncbi:MAG: beta-N-acetylhexosaminidase [Burkholderiales bacterium]|nr:beta-N-acetylhexosaminidase [Burkholderiales bacterium]
MEKVERRIGSIVVDIKGTELTDEEVKLLQNDWVGMVILFARNFENRDQLMSLTHDIHSLTIPPLLIGVDYEGGRIQRFQEGFTKIPSMRNIRELYDANKWKGIAMAAACGLVIASELRASGIDLNFAPCLDLDYGRSKVIGSRAFHRYPETVTTLATALVSGFAQIGMANCGKHFPGHGYALGDSHVELPTDDRTLDEIRVNDEVPYIAMGCLLTGIMPAHIIYPKVDDTPAGFSKKWLKDELRGRLGYTGMIFSDDLSMKGAAEVGDLTTRVQAAYAAGCDMVLICRDPSDKNVDQVKIDNKVIADLSPSDWIRTKSFQDRYARLQPKGKAFSWASLETEITYQACVKKIKAFNEELAARAANEGQI